jgi:polar amino acid transport system substrate-binding protein
LLICLRIMVRLTQLITISFVISLCLSAGVNSNALKENQVVNIGSYLTPGLIKSDSTGLFDLLNSAIFNEIGRDVNLSLSSINRVRRATHIGKLDGYFPELWETLPNEPYHYTVSQPIFYKRIILFTLKSDSITELSHLKTEPIGVVRGYSYGKELTLNSGLNLSYQDNDMVNIKLLLNRRISAVLGGFPGTVLAVKKSGKENKIHYDLNQPVAVLESFYVCKNDQDGIALCQDIDRAINTLIAKGVLELNSNTGHSRFHAEKYQAMINQKEKI